MKLHIFNPEHDIAMAYGDKNVTFPHAIQEFKMNLGYIPAMWADDGDCVLVDDVPYAIKALAKIRKPHADIVFVNINDLCGESFSSIEPWGWDCCLCSALSKAKVLVEGMCIDNLITDTFIDFIKNLSNRKNTPAMLASLRNGIEDLTCGESFYVDSFESLLQIARRYEQVVIKAPWSSSGRGIRYVSYPNISESLSGWAKNIIQSQGGLTVEPYYTRIKDFALEFYSHGDGRIDYCGLSLFNTDGCSYTGNIVASENYKVDIISKYLPIKLLEIVSQKIRNYLSPILKDFYCGPFGVDMMIVAGGTHGYFLHPCVELNLRRTMGHVANSIRHDEDTPAELMHIVHNVNYLLRFESLETNFVKVI